MAHIIKNDAIIDSPMSISAGDGDLSLPNIIVPLVAWNEDPALRERKDIGVWLTTDEEVEAIEGDLNGLAVIALEFPMFADGRSFSNANILRRRLGYSGEIRAIGDVRRDQMEQMHRCGFDAYQLAEGQDIETTLAGFKRFTHAYQQSIDRPEPLFRHR
jgi:uncharacterized protein (DUF934 family)